MWREFNKGQSIGERGSESGIIIRDEEHDGGARVTLERGGYTPFSITCGIYGWMAHTAFFASEYAAQKTFERIKIEIENILRLIPTAKDPEADAKSDAVSNAIVALVSKF
ncbi:MAG TPA: hypothetical protein VG324_16535 [Blastocatellia bacterium]|nr:hypothetical protein [Blastocatellia bacterium]